VESYITSAVHFYQFPSVTTTWLPSANLKNVCSGTVEMPLTIIDRYWVIGQSRKIDSNISPVLPLIFTGIKSAKFCLDFTTVAFESPSFRNGAICERLRSASNLDFTVPRTRTKFGNRAFSVAGPTVWNSTPGVRQMDEDSSQF